MNCPSARETFPELLDHRTAATAHLDARSHLASCPDCQREFSALRQTLAAVDSLVPTVPTARLRKNFYAMLEEEKHSAASIRLAAERRHRVHIWRWILAPVGMVALLAVGFLAGTRQTTAGASDKEQALQQEIVALRAQVTKDAATQRELVALREQMNKMGQLVGYSLLQQQESPANMRLQEVLLAARAEKPSDKVLDDLISALAFDPSVNVRLRALEALYQHADKRMVRAGVLASLPREQNPLVQLEMIDFLAAARDPEAATALGRLAVNEAVHASVREAARNALQLL